MTFGRDAVHTSTRDERVLNKKVPLPVTHLRLARTPIRALPPERAPRLAHLSVLLLSAQLTRPHELGGGRRWGLRTGSSEEEEGDWSGVRPIVFCWVCNWLFSQ